MYNLIFATIIVQSRYTDSAVSPNILSLLLSRVLRRLVHSPLLSHEAR